MSDTNEALALLKKRSHALRIEQRSVDTAIEALEKIGKTPQKITRDRAEGDSGELLELIPEFLSRQNGSDHHPTTKEIHEALGTKWSPSTVGNRLQELLVEGVVHTTGDRPLRWYLP